MRTSRLVSWSRTVRLCLGTAVLIGGLDVVGQGQEAAPPPAVLFTDIDVGPTTGGPGNLGAPIAIFGSGFGASRGTSTVTIGGVEAASYLVWGAKNAHNPTLDMVVVQPGPAVTGGAIVVTVAGRSSNATHTFTRNAGKIRYVAGSGSDAAECVEAAPCATIAHAIEPTVSNPGDTILVRGGTLQENEIWVRREYGHGGAAGQQKTIKPYPGESVTFVNGNRPFIVDADYVTVAGFKFLNGKSLGITETGDANRHRGNRLINNTYAGAIGFAFMDSHGDGHLLAGNTCAVTTSSAGTQGHCYYISYGDGVRVIYNIGGGAPGYGIHVFNQRRASVDFKRVISNLLLEGNIVRDSTERSGMILSMGDEAGLGNVIDGVVVRNNVLAANNHLGLTIVGNVRNVKVYNNTFAENGRQSLYVGTGPLLSSIEIRNNLFLQSANSVCRSNCSWYAVAHVQVDPAARSVTARTNGYFPGAPALIGISDPAAIGGSVAFVAPTQLDYRVQAGGSSIDRGESLADVPTDYLGVRRPNGPAFDVGAFEVPGAAPSVPGAPRGLRIIR